MLVGECGVDEGIRRIAARDVSSVSTLQMRSVVL